MPGKYGSGCELIVTSGRPVIGGETVWLYISISNVTSDGVFSSINKCTYSSRDIQGSEWGKRNTTMCRPEGSVGSGDC